MKNIVTVPSNGYATSANNLIRDKVVFDGGNRTTAWINPSGKIQIVPSIIKNLEDWELDEDAQGDEKSVIIIHNGERYVVGEMAGWLNGRPIFQKDKTEMALQLLLLALQPNPGERVVTVNELLIALPDSRDQNALANLKRIEGTHEFIRNAQHVVASVRRVRAIDETKGAYALAMQHGIFQCRNRINGILDLGGGTSIARLYSEKGSLMRPLDVVLPGTNALARQIDAALLPRTGKSQNLSLIMDAIQEGSYQIGTSEINFAELFEKAVTRWIDEIRERIKGAWSDYLPHIAEVLIVGGSAPLAKPIEAISKGRFKMAPSPQVFNLKGMELL
ncbi:MAG: ParM/StbA family protein [Desertifilum sp.]|nr:ParM/StbA family protein [Desertifilum sp.]